MSNQALKNQNAIERENQLDPTLVTAADENHSPETDELDNAIIETRAADHETATEPETQDEANLSEQPGGSLEEPSDLVAHQMPAQPNYLNEIDLSPPPEDGAGLIDPEKPSSSALIHENDLAIARNLRRLEIHRYEIAAALETLKSQELEGLVDEEDEIVLAETEQEFLALQQQRQERRNKRKNQTPDQILHATLGNLKSAFSKKARQLVKSKDIKNLEFRGHNFCHTWHSWRFDKTIEERLFRPEAECPALIIESDASPIESKIESKDENQADQELLSNLKLISKLAPLNSGLEEEPVSPDGEDAKAAEKKQPPARRETPETPTENHPTSLCAPVRLLNWSLDQLAAYLPEKSFRHFAFLDPSAGHGRTLLVAAERDFRAIWGCQPQADLAEAANMNIRQYPRSFMAQRTIDLYKDQPNISEWADYPMLVHIFKPVSASWLTNLREALHTSFNENPRQIYLVAIGNEYKTILDEAPFLAPFTPPVSNLEMFTLFSPYEINFYHSTIAAE